MLPERGAIMQGDPRVWRAVKIERSGKCRNAYLALIDSANPESGTAAVDGLVVVAEFRDTIYPGLVATGKVMRGGDKPCHTVINGESY